MGKVNMDIYTNEDYYIKGKKGKYDDEAGAYLPSHLCSPIVNDDPEFLVKNEVFYCKRHTMIKQYMNQLGILSTIYTTCEDPYICLFKWIESINLDTCNILPLPQICREAVLSFILHKSSFMYNTEFFYSVYSEYLASVDSLVNYILEEAEVLNHYYLLMKKVEIIKDHICYTKISYGSLLHYHNLSCDKEVFIFSCKDHKKSVGPTNLLLCVLDIYQSRFSLVLYWRICDFFKKYTRSIFKTGLTLIKKFELLRRIIKRKIYTFLSNWESLIIGQVVARREDLNFTQLYDDCKEVAINFLQGTGVSLEDIIIPNIHDSDCIKMYLELTGITKSFGHPQLYVEEGLGKLRETSTVAVETDCLVAEEANAMFIKTFAETFFRKRRRWPPIKEIPQPFERYFKMNHNLPKSLSRDLMLWKQVRFDKTFEYDYTPDTTELLKDTAAAHPMDQWFNQYDHCAFKILYNKPKPSYSGGKSSPRVIETYLTQDAEGVRKKIFELDHMYYNPLDASAVLCRKEREIKEEGRVFVKQTYAQRLAQTSMEHNIAKFIMRYIPEQTMTDGELLQMRRLTKTVQSQGEDIEILNLDLSKWNTRFRHSLVWVFGRTLDDLFGMENLYTYNHVWFITAQVFSNSRLTPPDYDNSRNPIPGPYFHNNHLGGLEGMRQKLWTIITVSIIKVVALRLGLSITVICQGDNQVVVIKYRPHQKHEKNQLRSLFLTELDTEFTKVNLKLKLQETWYSKKLFEYGKVRYYEGTAVSQGTKKISRLIPDINDGVCSFLTPLGTINTITESVSKMDFNPDAAFILNQLHILNYLSRQNVISKEEPRNDRLRFLYHPSIFGGLPLSTYFSHYIRGYDDRLSLWVSIIKFLNIYDSSLYKKVVNINIFEPRPKRDLGRLIEDIFCLNTPALPSIEMRMKECTLNYIKSDQVTNPEVRRLFDQNDDLQKEQLVNILASMKPVLFLSLAHEILRNSNVGVLLALRNKFSNIQTLTRITQESEGVDFLMLMQACNFDIKQILNSHKSNVTQTYYLEILEEECPTHIAEKLRKIHWNIDLIGATQPCPLHQFYFKDLDRSSDIEKRTGIIIQLSSEYQFVNNPSRLAGGPFESYLGSATQEKIKKPSLDMLTKTSSTKSLQQLILFRSWMVRLNSPNLIKLIDQLITDKENIIPEELNDQNYEDWCAINWGGNIIHRFRSIIERNTAIINHLPTIGTHIRQTTNMLAHTLKGGRDFTIHFQLQLLFNSCRVSEIKRALGIDTPQFVSVLTCNHCTKEVTDIKFDIELPFFINMPTLPTIDQPFHAEINISPRAIVIGMSINIGRVFGVAADIQHEQVYLSEFSNTEIAPCFPLSQVSINDFKYCDIPWLIVGLIQTSKILQEFLLFNQNQELIHYRGKSLMHLSNFILNAKNELEYCEVLNLTLTSHYSSFLPIQFSEALFLGIHNYIINHKKQFVNMFLDAKFKTDMSQNHYTRYTWLRKFCKTYLTIELDWPLRNILRLENLYNKTREILGLNKLIDLQSLSEDECIPLFRKYIIITKNEEKFKTKTRDPIIVPVVKRHYIKEITNYYKRLCTLEQGEFMINHFQHIIRPIGCISSAASKLHEILKIIDLEQPLLSDCIYCLAEGSGSMFFYLTLLYPENKIGYNTLLTSNIDLRLGPDQAYPPTIFNVRGFNKDCLIRPDLLAMGVTDITHPMFIKKLNDCFLSYSPWLLTMDAESSLETPSIMFLIRLYPLIEKFNIPVSILKLFYDSSITQTLNNVLTDKFTSIITKPISSNANNTEVYLVILSKTAKIDWSNVNEYKENVEPMIIQSILGRNRITTFYGFLYFLESAYKFHDLLYSIKSVKHPLFLKDNYSNTEKVSNCTIFCPVFLANQFNLIDKVFNMDAEDYGLYPIIRQKGVRGWLEESIYSLFLSLCIYLFENKTDLINSLMLMNNMWFNSDWRHLNGELLQVNTVPKEVQCMKSIYRRLIFGKVCLHSENNILKIRNSPMSSYLVREFNKTLAPVTLSKKLNVLLIS
uniref:Replicase n=1 Tax=Hymenopteran anphe-related virus OKIAV72 TaxID=2792597 RepID=A0A7T0M3I0_9MONO|nr:RNA-dependent RNA polymerase [Hymenopteran anphe-related virus OKIAV72]